MFHIVLVEPQIPPNTGNVIRLCANTGNQLHLVQPIGFSLEDSKLRRAGLDYHEFAAVMTHASYDDFVHWQLQHIPHAQRFAMTTKGNINLFEVRFRAGDVLMFGSETAGLSCAIRESASAQVRLPMLPTQRSLNLSNTVAVSVYEAWRQIGFVIDAGR